MNEQPHTLLEAIRHFSDPEICLNFMVQLRWPNGVACPTCGSDEVRFIPTRRIWECKHKHPRKQFSVKVGTIFEDSPIGLDKWLAAIWMIANDWNGISSYEVHRAIGVTQKTAWFMLHRIRAAMQEETTGMIDGETEVDETFLGGKARFMHQAVKERKITGTGGAGKAAVMGLLSRHGPDGHSTVRTKVIPNTRRKTLAPEVRKHVKAGSAVYIDALKAYSDLATYYVHGVIDHAE
jgi:hypothetical protein